MFGWLAFCAELSISTLSTAQPQPQAARASLVVIRSEGAQDCPEAAALADQVRAVVGASVIGVGPSSTPIETWVQVAISHDFGGYSAQISTFGRRHGSRSLEDLGPTCSSLADAIAVTLAMFLDPYENAPAPSAAAAPIASKKLLVSEPRPAARAAESQFFVDGSAGVTLNLLAHAQPTLGLGLGWRPSARWSLALGGVFVVPDHTTDDGTRGADLRLSFATLQVCARTLGNPDHISLAWCAAPQLGALAGRGSGYADNFSEHVLWLAVGLGPEAAFRLTRSFSWLFGVQAVIPLLEQGFDVQSDGVRSSAYRTPSVAALLSLGLRGHW